MGDIMIMAGGTGGHVFPALAIADELRQRGEGVFWLGVPDSFESRVVPGAGIEMEWVDVQGVRGSGLRRKALAPFKVLRAMLKTMAIIRRRRPRLAIGMGGFVTGPAGLMSRLMGVPLVIHEQNRIPGFTNRILSRIATRVLEAFPGTFPAARSPLVVGNPVRQAITAQASRNPMDPPLHLLVLGGSQGAQALNEAMATTLAQLPPPLQPRVRHQAGRGRAEETRTAYREAGVEAEVSEFIERMGEAYGWADLVVCRAGALTVSELAIAGRGAVLIPYPHAVDDHQTANAQLLEEAGAARIVQQHDFTTGALLETLRSLLGSPERLSEMGSRAQSTGVSDSARRMTDLALEACKP